MQSIYDRADSFVRKMSQIKNEAEIARERVKHTFNRFNNGTQVKKIRSYLVQFSDDDICISRFSRQHSCYETLLNFSLQNVMYTGTKKYTMFNKDWDISIQLKPELIMFNPEFHSVENEFQLSCLYSEKEMFTNYVRAKMNDLGLRSFYTESTDIQMMTRIPKALNDLR